MKDRPHRTLRRLEWVARHHDIHVLRLCVFAVCEADGHYGVPVAQLARASTDQILQYVETRLPRYTPQSRYLPWLAQELRRLGLGNTLFYGKSPSVLHEEANLFIELVARFRGIATWARAEQVDLAAYRADRAIAASSAWHRERTLAAMPQGYPLHTFDDGWTVQILSSEAELRAEGRAVQHCLEFDFIQPPPSSMILSLRDPKGHPHATMEWVGHERRVPQIRGKQNVIPAEPYLLRLVRFRAQLVGPEPRFEIAEPPSVEALGDLSLLGSYRLRSYRLRTSDALDDHLVAALDDHLVDCVFGPHPLGETSSFATGLVFPKPVLEEPAMLDAMPPTLFLGVLGLSWRVLVDHRVFLPQSLPCAPVVEDEMVAGLAGLWRKDPDRIAEILDELLAAAAAGFLADEDARL